MAKRYDSRGYHDAQLLTEEFMGCMSDVMGKLMEFMAETQLNNSKWFDVYESRLQGIQKTVASLVEEIVEARPKSAPTHVERAMTVTVITDTPVEITMSNHGAHVEVLKPKNIKIMGDSSTGRSGDMTTVAEKEATRIEAGAARLDKISSSEDEKIKEPTMDSFDVGIGLGREDGVVSTIDTGASANILPMNVYEECGLTGLKPVDAMVQLANGSLIRPLGIVENVPVRIAGVEVVTCFIVIPAVQFKVKDVVLLGRTFISKVHMMIDMYHRTCTIEVNGEQHMLRAMVHSHVSDPHAHQIVGNFGPLFVRNAPGCKRVKKALKGESSIPFKTPD